MYDSKKILIIDDNLEYVDLLKSILAGRGYLTDEAHNGVEGLERVKKFEPDLIILDMNMPRMDGMEFLKRILSRFGRSKIPVLVSTAREELAEVFESLSVDGFLPKPFKIPELLTMVEAILKGNTNPRIYVLAPASGAKVQALVDSFKHERYAVTTYNSIKQLESTDTPPPLAVVMEFVQSDRSGEEVISELKGHAHLKNAPVVVYSLSGFEGLKAKALASGADYFVSDPSNIGEFFHALHQVKK